ncbi:MAG TPA: ABC transporter substrate-binding protein [Chloroflexota bacterium]
MAKAVSEADVSSTFGTSPRRWTRRGFLITWGGVGAGVALLAACGPAAAPPAATSAPAGTTAPQPAPTTAPAAAPTTASAATTAPAAVAQSTSAAVQPTVAAAAGAPAQNGGTFKFNIWTDDPPSLDPYVNVSYRVQEFAAFHYSRLLMSKKGPGISGQAYIMEGDLAETWKPSEDGKTWTFNLRQNAKWHNLPPMNGRPVTAQDVVWSFNHFMEVSPNKTTFNQVANVTAPDDHTVQFTLKDVYAPFEAQIGAPVFWIMPKEVIEQDGDATKRVVGSGPFVFDTYQSGVSLTGKKNPAYYRPGEPHIDSYVNVIIPDVATQMAGIRAHEIDFVQVPDTEIAGLKQGNPELQFYELPFNLIPFVYWRLDKPPFNDVRVRQAVSMALNRDNIIGVLYNGRGGWDNFIPWALSEWWLDPQSADQGDSAKYFKYDPAAAKQLLAAAGFPNGLQVTMLSTPGYGDVFVQSVELVQQDLKTAGIDATIKMQDYAQYIATTFAGKFDGTDTLVFGLETPFTEPHDYLFNMYTPQGTRNHAGISDDKLNAMIDQQMRTLDRNQRKQQIFDIQRYIVDQMYYVPGVVNYRTAAYTPQMHDMWPRSDYGFGAEIAPKVWIG